VAIATYSYATLQQAVTALYQRLYDSSTDPTQQFWTSEELSDYIIEALRVRNALTSFWKADITWTASINQGSNRNPWWYDIAQQGPLRAYTVTQNDLITEIQYHLLEPPTSTYPLAWTGSTQFALSDITDALTSRQNETIGNTDCTISILQLNAPIAPGRIFLPDNALNIRRVSWQPETGNGFVNTTLRQSDPWAKRSFNYGYRQASPAPPQNWMQSAEPTPSFDVDRTPPVPGVYEILVTNAGSDFSISANTTLNVPDDWSWVAKYGALTNLFDREANAKDSLRMQYCQQRYDTGTSIMKLGASILALYINDVPVFADSVRNGDDFNALWQANINTTPVSAYTAGMNLIGLGPAPDSGQYGILLQTVINAPVPASFSEYIQVPRGDFDSVLDYAQHIATLKQGGAEFIATLPLYKRFLAQCATYNSKLKEMGEFSMPMYEVAQLEQERRPTFARGVQDAA